MKRLFTALTIALCASGAHAAVVDFQDLAPGNCAFYGSSVNSGGFQFTGNPADPNLFGCSANLVAHNTSNALINANQHSILFMSKVGGGTFDLASFEAGNRFEIPQIYGISSGIDVLGNLHGGGTVSQHFDFSGDAFGLFVLNGGFSNLDSVRFSAVTGTAGAINGSEFAIDNINTGRVPEPASLALLGLGLAAIAGSRRKS